MDREQNEQACRYTIRMLNSYMRRGKRNKTIVNTKKEIKKNILKISTEKMYRCIESRR